MDELFGILGKHKRFRPLLSDHRINKKLRSEWSHIMGKMGKQLTFLMVKKTVLYLGAVNYMWVNEIDYYKDQIINKINESLGVKAAIKSIKIRKLTKDESEGKFKAKSAYEGKTLEEKIYLEIERRKSKGERLCNSCGQVYTEDRICTFCRVQGVN